MREWEDERVEGEVEAGSAIQKERDRETERDRERDREGKRDTYRMTE